MAKQAEQIGHAEVVGGGQTSLHTHPGGGNGPTVKSGTVTTVSGVAFVTFITAFPDTSYAISLTAQQGADSNIANWSNKAVGGFDLRVQNDKGVNMDVAVDWIATDAGNL